MGLRRVGVLFNISVFAVASAALLAIQLDARDKKDGVQYGAGLMVAIPSTEADVLKAVEEVVQNGIIRGSKEYNKDEYIAGATAAPSTKVFPELPESDGKVFYKVRLKALDPRNFRNSGDVGTLAVRYIVTAQDEKNTILRIDARFVEDFRKVMHASNGSVESAEYKDIREHLDALELDRTEAADAKKNVEAQRAQQAKLEPSALMDPGPRLPVVPGETTTARALGGTVPTIATANTRPESVQDLQERVEQLRRQAERRVKAPGSPLRSAPFHTASTLLLLQQGTEVLIVIATPYWYGVETHDGQHGWVPRDELEDAP